jgi:tetratricopeptide (TPR) repeat protein
MADALDDVAQAIEKLGDLDEARAHYRRALAMARELGQVHLECFVMLHLARAEAGGGDASTAAATLHSALKLAGEHDFQTGRLMGLVGAAHLRLMQPDARARDVCAAWCRAALAAAGGNTDVRDAIPGIARALLDVADAALPAQSVDVALAEAIPFLGALAGGEPRAQAPP